VKEPVFRRGIWWQQQDDGTWLRWNEGSQAWERSDAPPPPDDAGLPPMPPPPGLSMTAQYGTRPLMTAPVPNYMVWAILVTLFCFLPTGIAAIVFASQVNTKLAAGDRAGAVEASNKAKMWSLISVAAGVVFAAIWFAVFANTVGNTDIDFGP
jgi:hypothetical protein